MDAEQRAERAAGGETKHVEPPGETQQTLAPRPRVLNGFRAAHADLRCGPGASAIYCLGATFGIFAQDYADVTVAHTQFEGGGTALKDWGAQVGSSMSVTANCTAITSCP